MTKQNAFPSLLLLLFIALKLTGCIGWSWWWVLSPALIPLGLGMLGLVLYIVARHFESNEARLARSLRQYSSALRRKP